MNVCGSRVTSHSRGSGKTNASAEFSLLLHMNLGVHGALVLGPPPFFLDTKIHGCSESRALSISRRPAVL